MYRVDGRRDKIGCLGGRICSFAHRLANTSAIDTSIVLSIKQALICARDQITHINSTLREYACCPSDLFIYLRHSH